MSKPLWAATAGVKSLENPSSEDPSSGDPSPADAVPDDADPADAGFADAGHAKAGTAGARGALRGVSMEVTIAEHLDSLEEAPKRSAASDEAPRRSGNHAWTPLSAPTAALDPDPPRRSRIDARLLECVARWRHCLPTGTLQRSRIGATQLLGVLGVLGGNERRVVPRRRRRIVTPPCRNAARTNS